MAEVVEVRVHVTAWLERGEYEVGEIWRGTEEGAPVLALCGEKGLGGRVTVNKAGSEGMHLIPRASPGAGSEGNIMERVAGSTGKDVRGRLGVVNWYPFCR